MFIMLDMAYEEFPKIPDEHVDRCAAAAFVYVELDTIWLVGKTPGCEHGTLRDMAIRAIKADCNPEECALGGLQTVKDRIEKGREHELGPIRARAERAKKAPKVVYVERQRESFWGDSFEDGGSLFGD